MPLRLFSFPSLLFAVALFASASLHAQTGNDSLVEVANTFMRKWITKDIAVRPSITFQHQVSYVSKKVSWQGEQNEVVHLKFNEGSDVIGVGTERELNGHHVELFIVFDESAFAMVNFLHSDTMDLAALILLPDLADEKKQKKVQFDRTDSSLTISGMEATKWVSRTDKETVELWVAPRKGLRPVDKAWGSFRGHPHVVRGNFAEGILLKARMTHNEGDKVYNQFEATEIKLNTAYTFSSEGYPIN